MINIVKPVYAAICNTALGMQDCATPPTTDPSYFLNNVLQTIITLMFIVAIIYFVWHFVLAGLHMISSQGDPKSFDTAKNELLYAFVGLFIIFSIFAILSLIGTITGIKGLEKLTITLPSL